MGKSETGNWERAYERGWIDGFLVQWIPDPFLLGDEKSGGMILTCWIIKGLA